MRIRTLRIGLYRVVKLGVQGRAKIHHDGGSSMRLAVLHLMQGRGYHAAQRKQDEEYPCAMGAPRVHAVEDAGRSV